MNETARRSGDRRRGGVFLRLAVVLAVLLGSGAGWAAFSGSGAADALGSPRFLGEAVAAGIEHVYDGDFTFFVGGGVAAFDCSEDEKPDLFLAGGSNPASLYVNESPIGGGLQFSLVASPVTDLTAVTGAYPLDVDGDGLTDLAVLRLGENVLLRGLGDCRFERANERWGFDGATEWTVGFSATWEGSNALPTLAFGNYLDLDESGQQFGGCSDSSLVRPDGDRYDEATALGPGWCALSILFSDWDRSGGSDLRVSNDRHYYRDGQEQLWRVAAGQAPRLYAAEEGWQPLQIWGMGISSFDVTGDGFPEVFLASQGDNKLQTLSDGPAQPSYSDIAIRRGVTAHRPYVGDTSLPSTAWHPEFQDVNNDGLIDLFITKGNVEAQSDHAAEDPSNLLLGQLDGTFVEGAVEAGLAGFASGRGGAVVDLNLDGLLDIVKVNRRENVELWRSLGSGEAGVARPMGNWVAIQLEQPGTNRDAVGAWIEVRFGDRVISRELAVGGGHAGGQSGWIHFGLGDSRRAEIRVQWPGGETGPWQRVDANQFAVIDRNASAVRIWSSGQVGSP